MRKPLESPVKRINLDVDWGLCGRMNAVLDAAGMTKRQLIEGALEQRVIELEEQYGMTQQQEAN